MRSRHWNNVYALFRTADGLGFDQVYVVDLQMRKVPKMRRRKIEMHKRPWDKIKLITQNELMELLPKHYSVSMELTDKAVPLYDFTWDRDPLIIVGPENGNIPDEILEITHQVKVPMMGLVRCFNVACAGSIAMYDAVSKLRD